MASTASELTAYGQPAAAVRIAKWPASPGTQLGAFGAETFDEEEQAIVDTLRKFAENEMRPLGTELDKLSAEQVIASNSPLWPFFRKFQELGFNVDSLLAMEPQQRAKIMCLFYEILGWGDSGLAISLAASTLPRYLVRLFGNDYLESLCPDNAIGCWGITEPDHGSDTLDPDQKAAHARGTHDRPNCVATFTSDKIIINGQKSAWVSNGTISEVSILYCASDTGAGPDPVHGAVVIVPCNTPGVTKGKPLEKMGQRALNQGEIFFDNVEVPIANLLAGPENYQRAVYAIHTEANGLMGAVFTGLAQRAFDLAHAYVHERKQGGVPIIRHQNVAYRLFHMLRKLEASRALVRRVVAYNTTVEHPALHAAMTAKVTGTQTGFDVANAALQLFGGNGMTREYPLEKLLRDARASLIEDGCNEILSTLGGYALTDPSLL